MSERSETTGGGPRRASRGGPRRAVELLRETAGLRPGLAGARAAPWARVAAIAAVFVCALGVRLLYATDALADLYGAEQERYRIAHFYHEAAASLAAGDDRVLFPRGLEPAETLLVGYPPGYFVVMAVVYRVTGDEMGAVLLLQCVLDAATAALLVLLGEALFSTAAGFVAGLLMALSPQFAYLSLVLKPDTLAVLPVAIALLLVLRALARPSVAPWVWAGLALGLACWLRQNALLLAPVLAAAALVAGGARANARGAALMLGACAVAVAPLAVRNMAIYGEPIPVTVGSGFALLSGLARDDHAGRYGLPRFAYNFSLEEAAARGLPPDYYFAEYDRMQGGRARAFESKHTVLSVFAVDGIARDRERTRRALEIIGSDPVYFASIYGRRLARLLGYTEQNRPVPLEPRPATRAHETLDFYRGIDPSGGLWRYYGERGSVVDYLRPPLARVQGLFVTPLVLAAAGLGLLLCAAASWRRALFLAVPAAYYLGLQSLMWAEFRHTLPAHLSLFLMIGLLAATLLGFLRRRPQIYADTRRSEMSF